MSESVINNKTIKILFLADTHLGFDLPIKPRIERRRRGVDFFENYERALQPALNREVDLVVHGGDLFFRSRVHPKIVNDAFQPLIQIADLGVPVYIVPGNHERSKIPVSLLESHRSIHIFDKPKTCYFVKENTTLALAGFPYYKNGIRKDFQKIIRQTGFEKRKSDVRILCMHHIVEGARVGVQNYTFRHGDDVIAGKDIPAEFDLVCSGHIHRWQILTKDLRSQPLAAPVLYPGSIERTSFAERLEKKGYFIVEIIFPNDSENPKLQLKFHELPTRPMYVVEFDGDGMDLKSIGSILTDKLSDIESDAVVKIKFKSAVKNNAKLPTNQFLRSIAPPTMNIEVLFPILQI